MQQQPALLAVTAEWIAWNATPPNSKKSLEVSDGFMWASKSPLFFTRFGFLQQKWQGGRSHWVARTYRKNSNGVEPLEFSVGSTPVDALSGIRLQNTALLLPREAFKYLKPACEASGVQLVHHHYNGELCEC